MTLDHVNFGLFDGAPPLVEGEQTLSVPLGLQVAVSLTGSI